MAKITKEEVLKLAEISKLKLYDDEIKQVIAELDAVLSYAERVCEIATDISVDLAQNVNVFRQDVIQQTDYKPIMQQAPVQEDNYFVVPKIIENE